MTQEAETHARGAGWPFSEAVHHDALVRTHAAGLKR